MNFPKFALNNQTIVLFGTFLLIAYGAYTWMTAPRREDPSFNVRDAWIITLWPGATAEEVETLVADPIETQLAGIKTTRKLDTVSYPGMCVIQLTTVDSVDDTNAVWDKVRRELKLVEPKLPPGALTPILNDHAGAATAMMLCLYQDLESAKRRAYQARELEEFAKRLRDRIMDLRPVVSGASIEGTPVPNPSAASFVERVDLYGVQDEVIYIETDVGKWSQLGLSVTQLTNLLVARNAVVPGGTIDTPNARFTVQTTGSFDAVREIERVSVGRVAVGAGKTKVDQPAAMATQQTLGTTKTSGEPALGVIPRPLSQNVPVQLQDLDLTVTRQYRDPPTAITRFADVDRSYPCVVLAFTMKDGMNIAELDRGLQELFDQANATFLPPDIKLVKVSNQPVTVDRKIAEVSSNVISSIAAVVLVLVLMAGVRNATIAALAIPAIMLIAIGLMRFWNIDIEQVSMAALIVALGILVDNTIQVTNNTQTFMDRGMSPEQASIDGPNQIGFSIFIATCTILAAFLPMTFCLTGGLREYAFSLPMVVSLCLAIGWVFAMTVTAIMSSKMLKPGGDFNPLVWLLQRVKKKSSSKKGDGRPAAQSSPYFNLCLLGIKAKWVTIAVAYAFFFAALVLPLYGLVPADFFPKSDRNQFVVDLFLPDGSPIQKTDQVQKQLEQIIRGLNKKAYVDGELVDLPEGEHRLENMASLVGIGGPYNFAGLFPKDGGSNYGIIWITTRTGPQVPQFIQDIRTAASEGIGQPGDEDYVPPIVGARVIPKQLISGVPVKSQIDIRLLGPRLGSEEVLREYGQKIADVVRNSGLAWDVHNSWGEFTRQLDIDVNQDKANLAGVTNASVLLSMNAFYSGHPLMMYREKDKQIPIMLRLPPEQRGTLKELEQVFVQGLTGKVPLDSIANIQRTWTHGKIHRYQRERCFAIRAEPEEGLLFSQVLVRIQPELDAIQRELPPGYRIEHGGTKEEADKGLAMNVQALTISAICIFFLLVVQFKSLTKPLMIVLTVPLSAGGGLLGLYIMGVAMGFMETVGFLALFGIVLSAAILLIEFSELKIKEKLASGEGLAGPDDVSCSGLKRDVFRNCLAEAGQLRLMPILMTTLTTVGGMLSLMFGGPLFKGMATVIVVGLSIGTGFTLFVLPAIYAVFVENLGMTVKADRAE